MSSSTARKYVSIGEFEAANENARASMVALKAITLDVKEVNAEKRSASFVVSDQSVDRDGDVISQDGIDWTKFSSNPVILFAHNSKELPVGRGVKTWRDGTKTLMEIEFAPADANPKAEQVYQLIKGGFLKAGSIGFLPKKAEKAKDRVGYDLKEIEAIEFSIVPVPANPNALLQAVKSGADTAVFKEYAATCLKEFQLDAEGNVVAIAKEQPKIAIKDLYTVSWLAGVLSSLGWIQADAEWEAEVEGDGSQVPAMLAAGLRQVGAALVAMTTEEVSELVGSLDDDAAKALIEATMKALPRPKTKAADAIVLKDESGKVVLTIDGDGLHRGERKSFIKAIGDAIKSAFTPKTPEPVEPVLADPTEFEATKALALAELTRSKALVG